MNRRGLANRLKDAELPAELIVARARTVISDDPDDLAVAESRLTQISLLRETPTPRKPPNPLGYFQGLRVNVAERLRLQFYRVVRRRD